MNVFHPKQSSAQLVQPQCLLRPFLLPSPFRLQKIHSSHIIPRHRKKNLTVLPSVRSQRALINILDPVETWGSRHNFLFTSINREQKLVQQGGLLLFIPLPGCSTHQTLTFLHCFSFEANHKSAYSYFDTKTFTLQINWKKYCDKSLIKNPKTAQTRLKYSGEISKLNTQ